MSKNLILSLALSICLPLPSANAQNSISSRIKDFCSVHLTGKKPKLDFATLYEGLGQAKTLGPSELNGKNFVVQHYIGNGDDGDVFRIKQGDKYFIIKLFKPNPSFTMTAVEQADAIEIQNLLSEAGFAPKIIGTMNEENLRELYKNTQQQSRFFSWHFSIFKHMFYQKYAVIMEEIQGVDMKRLTGPPYLTITRKGYNKALNTLHQIGLLLNEKGINPRDPDFMISFEGDVKLIDISRYEYFRREKYFYENFAANMTELLDSRIKNGRIKIAEEP